MLDSEAKKLCEELLKGSSNSFKRALKDMYLAFLEVRKHQKPSKEICKKLDDAIYRFVREYLKEYSLTECVKGSDGFMSDLNRYIFSSYMPECLDMPEYLKDCIKQLTLTSIDKSSEMVFIIISMATKYLVK